MSGQSAKMISQSLDEIIKTTSMPIDSELDHALCNIDDQMITLEELEKKIGKAIVAMDDLRGLIISRKLNV